MHWFNIHVPFLGGGEEDLNYALWEGEQWRAAIGIEGKTVFCKRRRYQCFAIGGIDNP